jgi:hypothetical protein
VRARRRSTGPKPSRGVPARSRVTVRVDAARLAERSPSREGTGILSGFPSGRRAGANLTRTGDLAAALRASREALSDIEGQLDALLAVLRDPAGRLDARAAEQLRGATRQAGTALARLGGRPMP